MTLINFLFLFLWSIVALSHSLGGNADTHSCVVFTIVEYVSIINTYIISNTSLSLDQTSTLEIKNAPTFLALTFTSTATITSSPQSEPTTEVAALATSTGYISDLEAATACVELGCSTEATSIGIEHLSQSDRVSGFGPLLEPTIASGLGIENYSSKTLTVTGFPTQTSVETSTPYPSSARLQNQIILSIRSLSPASVQKRVEAYVQSDGQVTSDCSQAAQLTLSDGRLYNSNFDPTVFYYAPPESDRAPFTARSLETIPSRSSVLGFSVDSQRQLHWNLNFTSPIEVLFALDNTDSLIAVFNGYLPPQSVSITLQASLVDEACPSASASSTLPTSNQLSATDLAGPTLIARESRSSAQQSTIQTGDTFPPTTTSGSSLGSDFIASTTPTFSSSIPRTSCPATCFKLAVSSPDLSTKYLYSQYQSDDEFLSFTSNYTLGQVFSLGVIEVPSLTTVLGAAATPQSNNLQFTMIDPNGNTVVMYAEQDQIDAGNQQVWFATKDIFDDREFLPIIGSVHTSDCTLDLSLLFNGADALEDCSALTDENPEDPVLDPTIYLLLRDNDIGCTRVELQMVQDSCSDFPLPISSAAPKSSVVSISTSLTIPSPPTSSGLSTITIPEVSTAPVMMASDVPALSVSSFVAISSTNAPESLQSTTAYSSAEATLVATISLSSRSPAGLTTYLPESSPGSSATTPSSTSSLILPNTSQANSEFNTQASPSSASSLTSPITSSTTTLTTSLSSSFPAQGIPSATSSVNTIRTPEVSSAIVSSTLVPTSDIQTPAQTTASSFVVPSSTSCKVPPPTYAPASSNFECCRWYIVEPGEDCAVVELKNNVSDAQFRELNPGIDENCFNLYSGIAYCVQLGSEDSTSPLISSTVAAPSATAFEITPIVDGGPLCTESSELVNGGFEDSLVEVVPWSLVSDDYIFPFLVSGEAYVHERGNALLVYKAEPQNIISWSLVQSTTPCERFSYILTFWIRSSGERNPTACPISVCFGEDCESVTEIRDYDYTYRQYQISSGIFNNLDAEGMDVSIQSPGCGQFILLDDISLDITGLQPPAQVIPPTIDCSGGTDAILCEEIAGCYWGSYYERCFPE
ncbi:hypothetical protein PVAG01_00782 [Phlyctema vagabunda]|uniref:LysM domain-containing protein n=1 Tax=Phlyctema vagabunda TaxID=108571 RepID=A0ABR4PV73_9HELO